MVGLADLADVQPMNVGRLCRWCRIGVVGCVVLLTGCGTVATVRRHHGGPPSPPISHRSGQNAHRHDVSAEAMPSSVRVEAGDTVYAIARRTGLSPADIITWNQLHHPGLLAPGQRLRLQPPDSPLREVSEAQTETHHAVAQPQAVASQSRADLSLPPLSSDPVNANAAELIHWQWPTHGPVIASFVAGDNTRQGIDIAGKEGQPVNAVSAGQVVYSGSGFVGYRELIIIKHTDQWLSAYAQNRQRLVHEGEQVKAGQQIALMGRTTALPPSLHFEIRLYGKPVDPLRYLPKP